jgi:hypothetical protein
MWYRTTEVIWAAVEEAFTHMTPDYLRKTSARTEFNCAMKMKGLHTNVLNS